MADHSSSTFSAERRPGVINRTFQRRLREFLWEGEPGAYVQDLGYGWNDGGCYILAQGLFQWVTQEEPPVASDAVALFLIEGDQPDGSRCGQQVVVGVRVDNEWLYLDGDGVSTEGMLLRRWQTQEWVENGCVVPFDPTWPETAHICQHPEISAALARLLRQHFGLFHPQDLSTDEVWRWGEAQLVIRFRQCPLHLPTVVLGLTRFLELYTDLWMESQQRPAENELRNRQLQVHHAARTPLLLHSMRMTSTGGEISLSLSSRLIAEAVIHAFRATIDLPVEIILEEPSEPREEAFFRKAIRQC